MNDKQMLILLAALLITPVPADSGGGGDRPDSTTVSADGLVPAGEFVAGGLPRATLYGPLPRAETRIDPLRGAAVGAALVGGLVYLHANMQTAWWQTGGSFRLKNDWDDVLQIDKAGHAYAAYAMCYALSEALMGAGVSWEGATLWGSGLGFLYQSYVEIQDGFAAGWGFSLTDMAANGLGAGLHLARYYVEPLSHLQPKYLYVPPSWIGAPSLSTTWIDDYNSSSFWLSTNLRPLLPASLRSSWPRWLTLAVGYAVTIEGERRERHLLIAIDCDMVALLPEGGHVWNWIRQTLNLVKLPAPALELTPDLRFHLLYPFRL